MTGASEGGIVTALLVERHPERFAGGLAACGPVGDFRRQIDHIGDFRVLFDYFFPGVLPGSPIAIPAAVLEDWDTVYVPAIEAAVRADLDRARQLVRVAGAPKAPDDAPTLAATAVDVLWYNVFGANDATEKLGGNPYDNTRRRYRGSTDDARLNALVTRVAADRPARAALRAYETAGRPGVPLVTLHTTGDPIIPAWHELRYALKLDAAARARVTFLTPVAYGHCQFTAADMLGALRQMVRRARTAR
jgi:pimeloyl-ACP methyl ester carboxylesterase